MITSAIFSRSRSRKRARKKPGVNAVFLLFKLLFGDGLVVVKMETAGFDVSDSVDLDLDLSPAAGDESRRSASSSKRSYSSRRTVGTLPSTFELDEQDLS